MKHHLPALESLKVFESAARQLSFSLAAQELCITKGAVSYQIRKLEDSLDCALFRRSTRQVFLTNAGQQLLRSTQYLFDGLTRTIDQIHPVGSNHDVYIGATTYVALRWLSPRIAAFSESNPGVSILLQHAVNSEDFKIQNVDFAIRWCEMEKEKSRKRLLELPMSLFPVCSPRLLERIGLLNQSRLLEPVNLVESPLDKSILLCEDRSLDLWQTWYANQKLPLDNPRRVISDANVRTQAAIDGQGWTLADGLMLREIESGVLVSPFSRRLEGYGYAIEASSSRYLGRDARIFRDWLIAHA